MKPLFWRFFFIILTSQVSTVVAVTMLNRASPLIEQWFNRDIRGHAQHLTTLESVSKIFSSGGGQALRSYIAQQPPGSQVRVYAFKEDGKLNNPLLLESCPNETIAIQRVGASKDESYLALFRLFKPRPAEEIPILINGREIAVPVPVPPIILGLLFSIIFAWLLSRYFASPIDRLRTAFGSLASGKLNTRLGDAMGKGSNTLAELGVSFDSMAGHLEALMLAQKKVLHEISHEMRSPLARLQAASDLARQQPHRLHDSLGRIERETLGLNALLEELLTLSRLESGIHINLEEAISLSTIIHEILQESTLEAEAKNCQLIVSEQAHLMVKGNARLLHRAIGNVVSNAIKYCRVDGNISIQSALLDDASIILTISDQGDGVAEEDLSSLFSPFFRAASGQHFLGFGLGLAICENIIKAHGGNISAKNAPTGGLSITIMLPTMSSDCS
ncbi:HAMP domain-containing sensor histidine kinase [Polynucleobacter sp. Fuers-14]|uniref:sensor histidine kinase n=1 Tax=Polynucleobacter sp. Fuers-14 TaxID=1758364 RepID=UPI001C0AB957|nr:ATP-binding protein [Polynucleobacter sp. Fuers-14]MBU3641977.1 HAMP domain-containing protein [Polynucleobacter sp. Fuers-14]